jgi:hypothetical protein
MIAAQNQNALILNTLLQVDQALVLIQDDMGMTALNYAKDPLCQKILNQFVIDNDLYIKQDGNPIVILM